MGLNMNVVFNLSTVEELDQLCKALKETATLQAKLALEKEIRDLTQKKRHLQKQIEDLRKEKNELSPNLKDEETGKKAAYDEEMADDEAPEPAEETEALEEEPSSLRRDGIQSIERLIEGNEDVDVSPGSPE